MSVAEKFRKRKEGGSNTTGQNVPGGSNTTETSAKLMQSGNAPASTGSNTTGNAGKKDRESKLLRKLAALEAQVDAFEAFKTEVLAKLAGAQTQPEFSDLDRADFASAITTWLAANKLGKAPRPGCKRNHDTPDTNRKRARMEKLLARVEQSLQKPKPTDVKPE